MITKTDYALAALLGFFAGIFAIPTLWNIGIQEPLILAAAPWIMGVLLVVGVWLGGFLSRWMPFFAQFGKFVAVGFFNTLLDFGVLNILSRVSGVSAGAVIGGINIPGFLVAVVNSYLWNQLWVFKGRQEREALFHDFPKFFAVTVGGVLINSGLIILLTTVSRPFLGLTDGQWLNIAKAVATIATLIWNFTGYKLVVFRRKS